MRIVSAKWNFSDYPEPDTESLTIFLAGCNVGCEGCHNDDLKDYNYGESIEVDDVVANIMLNSYDDKVVIMGGEPLMEYNREGLGKLISNLKDVKVDVCLYTSMDLDIVKEFIDLNKLDNIKYIKTGKFNTNYYCGSFKDSRIMRLASENQQLWKRSKSGFKLISESGLIHFNSK